MADQLRESDARARLAMEASATGIWDWNLGTEDRFLFNGHALNLALLAFAWLAGSRILELKTVQINDRLVLPRPGIDATNVGYNVEWSQELRLQSNFDGPFNFNVGGIYLNYEAMSITYVATNAANAAVRVVAARSAPAPPFPPACAGHRGSRAQC